jgi:hypothetical protein
MRPVATQTSMQNGQETSSPTTFRLPSPRAFSLTSDGPAVPSYSVKGARSGLVTGSLASSLLSLCVATACRTTSRVERPSGISRPVRRVTPASVPTSAE